ncbi:ChaN family lipoprotein [Klebsiella sp. NPDC088457]
MFNTEYFFKSLLISSVFALSGCQNAATPTSAATAAAGVECACILDAHTGKTLTSAQLLTRLDSAPLVIVGEEHTNVRHHAIEQWLLQNLPLSRRQGSVLMEMIDSGQQDAVTQVKQAAASGSPVSATRAAAAMRWNSGWPWDLYRDVVMTALKGPYPLLAANISRQQVGELYKNPTFPPGERTSRPQVRQSLAAIIYLMHDGQINDQQVNAMVAIQQHRDRFMAEQLSRAPRPALLIAGGYHAAKDVGVPLHLADLQAPEPVVVMLTTTAATLTAKQADYIWSVAATK